jgi:hypothetical protein
MVNYDDCYGQLKEKIGDMEITPQTIINVLRFAMEVVEASSAKGEEQKVLVEKLVKQVVVEAPISDFKEKLMIDMIDEGILGDMTNIIVSASKGELNINAVASTAGVCCKSCFGAVLKK